MANSATVRISLQTRDMLRELADRSGETMQSILDKAIEDYRRRRFLEEANRSYAALRGDPEKWRAEQQEREQWDATSADGLEP